MERKTAYNLVVELERILNEQLKLMDEKENAQSLDVINVLNQRIELLEMRLNRINAKIDAENLRLYGPNAEPLPKKHAFKYNEAITVRPNRVFK